MKWCIIPSVITCGLNSMLAAIILSLSIYHYFTNKSTNPPTAPNQEWIQLVINLIPFSAVWMLVSVAAIFISMTRRQIALASLVLGFFAIGFGTSIFFTVSFGNQLEVEDVKVDTLFESTVKEINAHANHSSDLWIPDWLNNVQKQSKQCCGLVTYRDYEEFWPNAPNRIPHSCCRDLLSEPCPDDLTQIPFPNTPDNYLKVETGCMAEINEATHRHIEESYNLCIAINIVLALGTISLLVLYVGRYLIGNPNAANNVRNQTGGGGDADNIVSKDDNLAVASGPMFAASSGQIIGSVNSLEDPQAFASVESVGVQERKPLLVSESRQPNKEPLQQAPLLMRTSSIAKINKANTVFAALRQQQLPEASTGDDMTVGGGNMGRREVYVAQDSTSGLPTGIPAQQQPKNSRVGGTGTPVKSNSQNDIAGDIIHVDPDPIANNQPNSQERGKKKKGRKFALGHGHNHTHHERNQ